MSSRSGTRKLGDRNQQIFLAKLEAGGPVLEVGSKNYGAFTSFTAEFRKKPGYVGVDLEAGDGVDVVADLSKTTGGLPRSHFALVICCSVLEHVQHPWSMAENLTELLRPGGKLYIAVPWTWRYHAYPDDYWRFSWSGIRTLFPDLTWDEPMFSTTREGEFFPAVEQSDNNLAVVIEGRKFIPYLTLHMVGTK